MASDEQRRAYTEYMMGVTRTGQRFIYPVSLPVVRAAPPIAPPAPTPPAATHFSPPTPNPSMPSPPKAPEYGALPQPYPSASPPAQASAYVYGWQYSSYPGQQLTPAVSLHAPPGMATQASQGQSASSQAPATGTAAAPPVNRPRSSSEEVAQTKTREQYYHYESEHRPISQIPAPRPSVHPPQIPVLLCHTCSECGRMRSSNFHRDNPVIPGQPLPPDVCRRCRKRNRHYEGSMRKVTRVRKCTAEEPCDWPAKGPPLIRMGHIERGKHRTRSISSDDYFMRHRSRGRSSIRYIERPESRNHMSLHLLQENRSPPGMLRGSRSVARIRSVSSSREVVPAPRYVHRSASQSPPPYRGRESIRYMDRRVSRSPPYRQYRGRSPSLIQREPPDSPSDAHKRIASHPAPYRAVVPPSPTRGILRDPELVHETAHRRRITKSQESTMVEVGAPRVQFALNHVNRSMALGRVTSERADWSGRTRELDIDDGSSRRDEYDYYHGHRGFRYHKRSPSPPARCLEQFHIRDITPPRGRSHRRSSTPHPHLQPSPPPSAQELLGRRDFSYVPANTDQVRSHVPSDPGRVPSTPFKYNPRDWEEVTATDSDASGEIVTVRKWRDLDEYGKPVTFVEERRTVHQPNHKRENSPKSRPIPGSWREI
ncbi:hypothetical protein CC78DRAFT_563829 [Lojkania enalia]|uniref:Uncharacterized protein n=1 Tax=Lojkania enalia TaxID=147567 RepID=A0A9P4TRC1_9PLEO|nr:hypothetical protein CC78DRAFT_563829 [Didymosphaeria enalia]